MSPEQAAGRLEEQGVATDVYGLGATLYAVLTGRAPVTKSQAAEILEKVKHGDLPWPRQVNAAVPRPLDAVCRKAMALKPADRYPTVMALANDVERWLAGETVTAYPEPWLASTFRWVRRHRTAVTFVTAVIVTAALGLTAGLIAVQRERERSHELERRILSVLQLLETVNRAGGGHGEEAVRQYQQSLALLEQMAIGRPTWENRILYVSMLRALAELHRERQDYAEARQLLQKAVDSSLELVKAAPNVPRYRETFLDNLTSLAETLTNQHEHAAASEAALRAVGASNDAAEGAYSAARILSKCRPAEKDASLSAAERNRLYDDRAMELLREAVAKGFKNDALLKDNNDFAPLRNRPDFKQLLAELESKRK
jgi:hypothetical protein